MPPTATLEDIKAYQEEVEKDKITPHTCLRVRGAALIRAFSRSTHTGNAAF